MPTCLDHPKITSLKEFIKQHEEVLKAGPDIKLECGKDVRHIYDITLRQLEALLPDLCTNADDARDLMEALALIFTCFLQQAAANGQLLAVVDQTTGRLTRAEARVDELERQTNILVKRLAKG